MTGNEAKKKLKDRYSKQNDYIKDRYDRVTITFPKGTKPRIEKQGVKVNTIVNELVLDWLTDREKPQNGELPSLLDDVPEIQYPFK